MYILTGCLNFGKNSYSMYIDKNKYKFQNLNYKKIVFFVLVGLTRL